MSYPYGFPPPFYGPSPNTTLVQQIEDYQKSLELMKDFAKKQKEEEDKKKKPKGAFEGLTKRDIFWVMTLFSPVVGWGVLNVFILCLQSMATLLQQPILK